MAYEDFTTFTEVDEGPGGADITVDSAAKVSWLNLQPRWYTGYLYKDKGVNHFAGDFTHKFEIEFAGVNANVHQAHWMIANMVGDVDDIKNASEDAQLFSLWNYNEDLYLHIIEGGSVTDSDLWPQPGPLINTTYYIEIVRDDDGGANNTGRLTAYIRTGSHTGTLKDTLVVDCSVGQQNDFRYIYAVATDNDRVYASESDGFTQNLDLGEVQRAAPTGIFYGPLVGPLGGPI